MLCRRNNSGTGHCMKHSTCRVWVWLWPVGVRTLSSLHWTKTVFISPWQCQTRHVAPLMSVPAVCATLTVCKSIMQMVSALALLCAALFFFLTPDRMVSGGLGSDNYCLKFLSTDQLTRKGLPN